MLSFRLLRHIKDAHAKNTVLITHDALDRSPCGTRPSAKLAALYAKNKISLNQRVVHESIIGSLFKSQRLSKNVK